MNALEIKIRLNECIRNNYALLDLRRLKLTELPKLPDNIQILYCDNNCLSHLPENLPDSLTIINCGNNKLTNLPNKLPKSLKKLYCGINELVELPETLPDSLHEIN